EYAHTLSELLLFEKAIPQYELALSLYPQFEDLKSTSERIDLSNTYIGLARAYTQTKNFEEAHSILNKVKEENQGRIQIERAMIYIEQKNNTEDIQAKKKLQETAQQILLQVGQNQIYNQKIRQEAYFKLGLISQSIKEQLENYKKADQNSPQVLFNIGNCFLKMQEYPNAAEYYLEALEKSPKRPIIGLIMPKHSNQTKTMRTLQRNTKRLQKWKKQRINVKINVFFLQEIVFFNKKNINKLFLNMRRVYKYKTLMKIRLQFFSIKEWLFTNKTFLKKPKKLTKNPQGKTLGQKVLFFNQEIYLWTKKTINRLQKSQMYVLKTILMKKINNIMPLYIPVLGFVIIR
ncbi:hypothetical protein IMG5_060710, partial [Ichthyophthirius multifiliis]